MTVASDFTTLLQLSVALNWAVGAYASHRRSHEEKITAALDDARLKIDELVAKANIPDEELPTGLEKNPIRDLNERQLSRLLSDASIRFHRRRHKFSNLDKIMDPLCYPLGLAALLLLTLASYHPEQEIQTWASISTLFVVLLVPTIELWRLQSGVRTHQRFARRLVNDSYRKKAKEGHDKRIRSAEKEGEIFRAINEVRLRHRKMAKEG